MFNKLLHNFYLLINDIKLELGLITEIKHVTNELQEEIRYNSIESRESLDSTVEAIGNYFDDLVNN